MMVMAEVGEISICPSRTSDVQLMHLPAPQHDPFGSSGVLRWGLDSRPRSPLELCSPCAPAKSLQHGSFVPKTGNHSFQPSILSTYLK